MKKSFQLFLGCALIGVLSACASQTGEPVDYATLISKSCSIANAEIGALNAVRSELAAKDTEALDKVSPLVAAACSAPVSSDAYTTLLALLPAVTVIAVTYNKQAS